MSKDGLYTIGETAKLFGISVKTLRYYDEIGLFDPYQVDTETDFRYYCKDQFERLRLILYLRSMGLPLEEIGAQLRERKVSNLVALMKNHWNTLEHKINEYQEIKRILEGRIKEIEHAQNSPKNEVFFEEFEEQSIILHRTPMPMKDRSDMRKAILSFQQKYGYNPSAGRFCQFFTIASGTIGVPSFDGIFLNNYGYNDNLRPHVIPGGLCAVLYYRWDTDKSEPFWISILSEIKNKGYEHTGEAFRTIVIENGLGIDDDEYLAQIRIPVHKKNNL